MSHAALARFLPIHFFSFHLKYFEETSKKDIDEKKE